MNCLARNEKRSNELCWWSKSLVSLRSRSLTFYVINLKTILNHGLRKKRFRASSVSQISGVVKRELRDNCPRVPIFFSQLNHVKSYAANKN